RYFVDVFTVSCLEEQPIEWSYHNLGELSYCQPQPGSQPASRPGEAGPPPVVPEPLRLRHAVPGEHDVRVAFTTGAAQLDVWLRGMPASAVLAAEAPANPA